ncbi:hypothetical protein KTAU_41480 [Thermogemmatispora aurantia]|nr:hypothetical protein KTAU_41480 [Thermogemmatispora aurantia]
MIRLRPTCGLLCLFSAPSFRFAQAVFLREERPPAGVALATPLTARPGFPVPSHTGLSGGAPTPPEPVGAAFQ